MADMTTVLKPGEVAGGSANTCHVATVENQHFLIK